MSGFKVYSTAKAPFEQQNNNKKTSQPIKTTAVSETLFDFDKPIKNMPPVFEESQQEIEEKKTKERQILADSNYALIGVAVKDEKLKNVLFKLNSKISTIESKEHEETVLKMLKGIRNLAVGSRPMESDENFKNNEVNIKVIAELLDDALKGIAKKKPDEFSDIDINDLESSIDTMDQYQNCINYSQNALDGSGAFRNEKSEEIFNALKTNPYTSIVPKEIESKDNGLEASDFNPLNLLLKFAKKDLKQDFVDDVRFTPLKELIQNNQGKGITNSLYKNCYSSLERSSIEESLNKINSEFNTKVFLCESGSVSKKEALEKIYNELTAWKKAGGNAVVFPPVLDLNNMEIGMLFGNIGGYATYYEDSSEKGQIRLNTGEGLDNMVLRHEMTHTNDTKKDVRDFEKPEQYYEKYIKEFKNAGITDFYADEYAFKNKKEFIAVASQGDMSKYSPELKKELISMGMPEWMFNLPKP